MAGAQAVEPSASPPAESAEEPEPDGYRPIVDEALREYDLGHFEEARALFARAHGLFPNARTLRGLGKTDFELRDYRACIAHLEGSLRSPVRPLDEKLREDTSQLLVRARGFVGGVMLDAKPSATEVRVDDQPVVVLPGQPLMLDAGEHQLTLQAPGYALEKRRIRVQGGKVETMTVVFATPLAAPKAETETKRRWYRSPWLWSAVGVVAVAATTGAVIATRNGETPAPYDRGSSDSLAKAP